MCFLSPEIVLRLFIYVSVGQREAQLETNLALAAAEIRRLKNQL